MEDPDRDAVAEDSIESATDARADAEDARADAMHDARPDAAIDAVDAMEHDAARDAEHDAAADAPPPEPNFDTLPWRIVGHGVAYKDSHNPLGENVFIGYAGLYVTQTESEAWVTALFHAWLRDRGVRYAYAVQGPADISYSGGEIGNSHLISTMLPTLSPRTHFIAVAGHSSGGWVACELLDQLYHGGLDPHGLTRGRLVYYDLDGVQSCVDETEVAAMRRVFFVSAHTNVGSGGWSFNATYMMEGAMRLGSGGFHAYDASHSGCAPGDAGCLHVSLINTHPITASHLDYADFSRGPVNSWIFGATESQLPL